MNRRVGLSFSGFTLVELMIVVALIALLAGLSTPSLVRTIERNNAKKAARDVGNAFNLARNQAMSRGEVVLLRIDAESGEDRGTISLFRTANRALSCTTAQFPWGDGGFGGVGADDWGGSSVSDGTDPFFELDFSTRGGDLAIRGISGAVGTEANPICISSNGRVMSGTGATLDSGTCPLRVFVGKSGAGAYGTLSGCEAALSAADRQTRRDDRDIARFYVVELPYNGTVRIIQ